MSPQLLVSDLARSIGFYTRKLKFMVDFRYDDFYAGINRDGYSIHLKLGTPNREERERRRQNDDLDLLFGVTGIDSLYREIESTAVEVTQPPREMPYGREFYISDPDGYILGFLETRKEVNKPL